MTSARSLPVRHPAERAWLDYGGMGPNVTFNEILLGGTAGPDTESGAGPWTDSSDGIMAHGGNYQIRVTSIDPRWHVAIYPS